MKKKPFFLKKLLVCTTAATLLVALNANAFTTGSQVETVGNLLLNSSAARKVEASENKEVKAIYQQAKDDYQKAKDSNEPEEIKRLLAQVVKQMVTVGKMADQGAALGDKHQHDFENRLESIKALLTAQESIAQEKENDDASKTRNQVKGLINQAQEKYNTRNYVQGRDILDQAYNLLKTSIEQMRGGDTLVNTLVFDTPADEFEYYQVKTNSQLTALNIFKEKSAKPSKQKMIGNITKTAKQFIGQATNLANEGDYNAAIALMEKALTRLQSGLMMALN